MFIFKKVRTDIKQEICSAINTKRIIKFDYHDGLHHVEPFCLGVLPGGAINESLRCYQISGESMFDNPIGWKLYRLSDISSVEITGEHFAGNRYGYDPDNSEMATIYCAITVNMHDYRRLKKVARPSYQSEITIRDYDHPKKEVSRVLSHNELMRRFRFFHIKLLPWFFGKRK